MPASSSSTNSWSMSPPSTTTRGRRRGRARRGEPPDAGGDDLRVRHDRPARLCAGRLFEPGPDDGDSAVAPVERRPLPGALEDLHAAAMRLHTLDPVTTESAAHCARDHDCRTSMSPPPGRCQASPLEEAGVAAVAQNDLSALDNRGCAALALARRSSPTRRGSTARSGQGAPAPDAGGDRRGAVRCDRVEQAEGARGAADRRRGRRGTRSPTGFDAAGKPVIG